MKIIIATPSPFVRKVRVILREKNLNFEEIIDIPWNSETLTDGVNPLGKSQYLLMTILNHCLIVKSLLNI